MSWVSASMVASRLRLRFRVRPEHREAMTTALTINETAQVMMVGVLSIAFAQFPRTCKNTICKIVSRLVFDIVIGLGTSALDKHMTFQGQIE